MSLLQAWQISLDQCTITEQFLVQAAGSQDTVPCLTPLPSLAQPQPKVLMNKLMNLFCDLEPIPSVPF